MAEERNGDPPKCQSCGREMFVYEIKREGPEAPLEKVQLFVQFYCLCGKGDKKYQLGDRWTRVRDINGRLWNL